MSKSDTNFSLRKLNILKTKSLDSKDLTKFKVVLGTVDRTHRQYKFNVEKVVINDCFNIHGIGFDDIALLRTDRDIPFVRSDGNFLINSVCLPKGDPIDLKVFFSGWGQYSEYYWKKIYDPKFLKKTSMQLSDMESCRATILVSTVGLGFASIDNLCVDNSDSTACYVRTDDNPLTDLNLGPS